MIELPIPALLTIWLQIVNIFNAKDAVTDFSYCLTSEKNTGDCSYSGWVTPGYASKETWRRDENTPTIFYGRAAYYHPNIMENTAIARGFSEEYLKQFDCLVSGFYINDVGRTAWMLHEGKEYKCLVVDNARAADMYETLIINREAVEVSWNFARNKLGIDVLSRRHSIPVVVMAYQNHKPTTHEWLSAKAMDEYLYSVWEGQYYAEPTGWVKVMPDFSTKYKIIGSQEVWHDIENIPRKAGYPIKRRMWEQRIK